MGKTLIIAEKPSVASDISKALGKFQKHDDYFENDEYVISSAVGHLLELIMPEEFDVKKGKWTSFPRSVKLKPTETVMFSYIVYKSRKDRDRINAKVMKDNRIAGMDMKDMPFDGRRMIYGGFKSLVEL